jgi:hypothetical protein|tara:strand:+ start:222 stop:572 length:351 start_codon:yes stop_codon:yes gene_type:complete
MTKRRLKGTGVIYDKVQVDGHKRGRKAAQKKLDKISKDFPVLKDKAPDRPKKSKRGSRYRSASLSTFHKGERIIANAENKPKRSGPKISKIRKAFARVPLAAFRLGGGGGGGAGRK